MNTTKTLQRAFHKSILYLKRSSPTILTCVAAVGVVATTVTAVKSTPKAIRLLEKATDKKGEVLTKFEVVKIAGPCYIATTAIGLSTIACIFGANVLNKHQQAVLTSAYALLDTSYKEYKNKVKALYGADADKNIRNEIAKDKYKSYDIPVDYGKRLFFEEISGRYFESTIEEVREAEYHLNRNFTLRGDAVLNEFYEFLGLPETDYGNTVGWNIYAGLEFYGYQWIDFEHDLITMDDGRECYVIHMPFAPTREAVGYDSCD